MDGITSLKSSDFKRSGSKMINGFSGFTLVFFFVPSHPVCKRYFRTISRMNVTGANVGVIDVKKNSEVIQKSLGTNTEIKKVPMLIFYVDGIPFMKLESIATEDNINMFVKTAINKIKAKRTTGSQVVQKQTPQTIESFVRGQQLSQSDYMSVGRYASLYRK